MTTNVGFVSSEGGPYVITDAVYARNWRGIDGPDYDELCSQLDARTDGVLSEFRRPALRFLTWEPGIGVADVLRENDQVVLVHPSGARPELSGSMDSTSLEVEVKSGLLAVLWAPENGECIRDQDLEIKEARSPSGLLAIDGSSLLVPVIAGVYRCFVMSKEAYGQNVSCLILRRNGTQIDSQQSGTPTI